MSDVVMKRVEMPIESNYEHTWDFDEFMLMMTEARARAEEKGWSRLKVVISTDHDEDCEFYLSLVGERPETEEERQHRLHIALDQKLTEDIQRFKRALVWAHTSVEMKAVRPEDLVVRLECRSCHLTRERPLQDDERAAASWDMCEQCDKGTMHVPSLLYKGEKV